MTCTLGCRSRWSSDQWSHSVAISGGRDWSSPAWGRRSGSFWVRQRSTLMMMIWSGHPKPAACKRWPRRASQHLKTSASQGGPQKRSFHRGPWEIFAFVGLQTQVWVPALSWWQAKPLMFRPEQHLQSQSDKLSLRFLAALVELMRNTWRNPLYLRLSSLKPLDFESQAEALPQKGLVSSRVRRLACYSWWSHSQRAWRPWMSQTCHSCSETSVPTANPATSSCIPPESLRNRN